MQAIRVGAVVVGLAASALALGAVGCSGITHPSASSPAVKTGELGNGGFTFRCDDSVACDRWNNADTFPSDIALGANFELQFLLREDSRGYVWLKDAERGTTIEPVGKYIGRGASGFAAVEAGIATLSARDQKGWLVDYTTVNIRKPDSLIVYDSEYKGENPARLQRANLGGVGERKGFRVVAQQGLRPLAGAIAVEWTSDDEAVVAVEGYSRGKVTIVATGKGEATLTAKGAGLEQKLSVTVGDAPIEDDAGAGDGGSDAGSDAAEDGGQ